MGQSCSNTGLANEGNPIPKDGLVAGQLWHEGCPLKRESEGRPPFQKESNLDSGEFIFTRNYSERDSDLPLTRNCPLGLIGFH